VIDRLGEAKLAGLFVGATVKELDQRIKGSESNKRDSGGRFTLQLRRDQLSADGPQKLV